jgi:hypothetical protein
VFTFRIVPDNGEPYEVRAGTRDVAAWERSGKDNSMANLERDLRISDLYWIAYLAAKRQGLYGGTQSDFEASVDLSFDWAQTTDPTNPEASTA